MRFLLFIIFIVGLCHTHIQAQQVADTLNLGEVNVQASRIYVVDKYQPIAISRVDSAQLQTSAVGNISLLLENFTPVHVRTNGPGGLATFSQRGYSPSQTQVLWNGFQLNHAMLGLTDLSLIPSFAIGQIKIASGNGNTSFGDKGGGTVALQTRKPGHGIGFSQSVGSFGQYVTEGHAGITFGNWSLGLTTGLENSANDFSYSVREFSNEAGGFVDVEKRRTNNRIEAQTAILSLNWQEKQREFATVLWAHDMHNEIPGSISGLTPNAYQDDAYFRWMSRYSTPLSERHLISGKAYFNRQQLDFINPDSDIHSLSTSNALIGDVELRSSVLPSLQLISALQFSQSWVEASDYSGSPSRSQFTAQVNPVWHPVDPLHVYGGFRFDHYTDFNEAYSGNAGVNVEVIKNTLFLKGQISRNFIAPTFNDLYWPALGDPDLDPETNLKYETGLLLKNAGEVLQNSIEFTWYDGRVEDGIRWLPGSDGQSRPQNLEELRLWGFEVREQIDIQWNNLKLNLRGTLIHSLAELTKPRFEGDRAINKQLRYTPRWQVKTSAFLQWKGLNTSFSYNFTDERFSTADHSSPFDPMPAYRNATLSSSYQIDWRAFRFIPQASIQNLLDEDYSVIRDYPMPGRSYQMKLTIQYKLK